jgi:hypothetical protein
MRLAYTTYGVGHARLIAYRDPKKEPGLLLVVRADSIETGKETSAIFREEAPYILVGPPMIRRKFTLEAWENNVLIGVCCGEFTDGLTLSEKQGYFERIVPPRPLIEHETIKAAKSEQSAGLSPTDIVLLSRKWSEVRQLVVKSQGLQWWDDNGLIEEQGGAARRVTGWSLSRGALVEIHAAFVAVLSGPLQGHAGLLLWGDDGGIRVGGGIGEIRGAAWVPGLENFPQRVTRVVQLPPYSVTQRNTPISGLALGML